MVKLKQHLGLKQRTSISLQLKNSLKILSLNTVELSQDLQNLLNENIFLEEVRPAEISLDDVMLHNYNDSSPNASESTFESYTSQEKTLQEHLNDQLMVSNLTGRHRDLASEIISSVNPDGFIHEDPHTLALKNGYTNKELGVVLKFFSQIDPLGVCARDVWQSLEWQAAVKYKSDNLLMDILAVLQQGNQELTRLDKETISSLKDFLGVSEDDIKKSLDKIKTLNINPAGNFKYQERNFIIPEVIFSVKENTINVSFSSPLLPEISVNEDLFQSLQKDKKIKEWKEMYYEAKNVIKSIDYRKNSILKIAKIIASRQKMFFKKGEKFLKPMILKDIAEITKLNISTVSRILKNKYCVTPFGIFPMSFFLMKKVKTTDGEDLGVEDLKKSISFIVEQENKIFPLSDSQIMEKLTEYGFNVKRRTVAKYRKLLHIPSAKQRTVTH